MERLSSGRPHARAYPASLCAATAAAATLAVYINTELVGRRFLEKLHLDWTPGDLTEAGLAVTLTSAIAGALLAAALTGRAERERLHRGQALPLAAGIANLVLLIFTAWAVIFARETLALWVQELRPVALAQEIMIALATMLLGLAAWRARGIARANIFGVSGPALILLLAAALFLLLMEEISWGQHIFGWSAPDAFSANLQHETNLHNFYTHRFEFLYYSGVFAVFVVLPLLAPKTRFAEPLSFYIPPAGFALAALPSLGFMSEDWGIVPFQIYFFSALALAAYAALVTTGATRLLASALLLALPLSQATFLAYGHQLVLSTETGEMRETAITLLILTYSLWLARRVETARVKEKARPDQRRPDRR